jgi:hypothetical protein
MTGKDSDKISRLIKSGGDKLSLVLGGYQRISMNSRIGNIGIYVQDSGMIKVTGLQVVNVDAGSPEKVSAAYKRAVEEAKNIALYLSDTLEEFKGWSFSSAAEKLYIPEYRHFRGAAVLGVNEVLENTFPVNTISVGNHPVQAGKFANGSSYIAGVPKAYGVPLGCIIIKEKENLLMTGSKISYSSLAASSAGVLGTGITTGESAGILSVFCLMKDIVPMDILEEKDQILAAEFRKYLEKEELEFKKPELDKDDNSEKNMSNWSYTALRELRSLGLVAGGYNNDYRFDTPATTEDLALILLNGIYRLDRDKYTLQLDSLLRPYFVKEKLTRGKAAEILQTLYGGTRQMSGDYAFACSRGYINDVLQLRLKDKQVLTLDDVYYLGSYTLKSYTGKDIE